MAVDLDIYPRTISIYRAASSGGVGPSQLGDIGYVGESLETDANGSGGETCVAYDVPCSIQARAMGKATGNGVLPADAPGPPVWKVFIPDPAVAKGAIRDRDTLVDDEGYRYAVASAYWHLLGWALNTIRLEN